MMFMFASGVSKVLGKGIIFSPEQFEEVAYLRISKVHVEWRGSTKSLANSENVDFRNLLFLEQMQ